MKSRFTWSLIALTILLLLVQSVLAIGELRVITIENAADVQLLATSPMQETPSDDGLLWSPDSVTIAVTGREGLWLYDPKYLDDGPILIPFTNGSRSVAFAPDAPYVLTGGRGDSTVRVWDLNTNQQTVTYVGTRPELNLPSIDISLDGTRVLAVSCGRTSGGACSGGIVYLWDRDTQQLITTLDVHGGWINSSVFSPTEPLIATAGLDTFVGLWNYELATNRLLPGHTDSVFDVQFSPAGETLISGSRNGEIFLWDVETGELIRRYVGHQRGVWDVAFNPDGTLLASVDTDGVLFIWNVETGESVNSFNIGSKTTGVAFSPRGDLIATASYDLTLRIWGLPEE